MKIVFKIFLLLQFSLMVAGEVMVLPERIFTLTQSQTEELSAAIERYKDDCAINTADSYYMQRRHELALAAVRMLQRNYNDDCFGNSVFKDGTGAVAPLYFGKRFYYRDNRTNTIFMTWGTFKDGYVSLGRKVSEGSAAKRQRRKK